MVITGASTGIGEQLAYQYARLGANIVITARREQRLKEVTLEGLCIIHGEDSSLIPVTEIGTRPFAKDSCYASTKFTLLALLANKHFTKVSMKT